MQRFFFILILFLSVYNVNAEEINSMPVEGVCVKSPSGLLSVGIYLEGGRVFYDLSYSGKRVMEKSSLGFVSDVADFTNGLSFSGGSVGRKHIKYEMSRTKTSKVDKQSTEAMFTFADASKHEMTVQFVVEDNDVAFRYLIPEQNHHETKIVRVESEASSFKFPVQTTTFLCPQITPLTGWKRSKPSYEEEYTPDEPMSVKSKFGVGYTFPCLFKVDNECWVLVSETGVTSDYCGSRLSDYNTASGYSIAFPQQMENNGIGSISPAFGLPGSTPWRTISVGGLKDIVETTIPFDVVEPLYKPSMDYQPGRYTWSWLIWQDNSVNYDDQIKFIDLASKMGYEYCLVDGLWDKQIGRKKVEQLASYAKTKNVRILLWYNSNGMQNDAPQGPRDIMNNPIRRKKEMAWMKSLGVAGIKVDFFGGDKQETMRLYEEILSDANDYGIQVIFHGCTLPRGWERMYPNYVSSEAALASENVFFTEHHARREGFEMTMHPFSRNAVGSFDWGGVIMNKFMSKDNKSRHKRYTTDIFELATAITNQTSVNCVEVTPQCMDGLADWEMDFLRNLPTTWEEVRFLDGYPTRYVILARRHADKWYVAGINGTDEPLKVNLNLDWLAGKQASFYLNNQCKEIKVKKQMKCEIPAMGGIILVEK